jgi:hypothetical protein
MPSITGITTINRVKPKPAVLVFGIGLHLSKALSHLPICIASLSIANLVHIGKILLRRYICNLRGLKTA